MTEKVVCLKLILRTIFFELKAGFLFKKKLGNNQSSTLQARVRKKAQEIIEKLKIISQEFCQYLENKIKELEKSENWIWG